MEGKISELSTHFSCKKCGAELEYSPEASSLKCPYCGQINQVDPGAGSISETDYEKTLKELEADAPRIEKKETECGSCGSVFSIEEDTLSTECPFCATPTIIREKLARLIKPEGIHPFRVGTEEAKGKFAKWIKKRWFLPSEMKEMTFPGQQLTGIYLPYWTYDAGSMSWYTGERGIRHQRTENYTAFEGGKNVTKQRTTTYTEWTPVSGLVHHDFDDVLVPAGKTIPEKFAELIQPWKLMDLKPFKEEYLSGFRAETYSIGVRDGFEQAKKKMASKISDLIRRDIGGNEQRIITVNTTYDSISFKHVLLPLWMSSYRYKDNVYRFVVNGVTGEVQGNRPWSKWKILLLILTIIIIILGITILT
jgi:predicted RNA-binding Zn-ribbon protein involved in translation (DUF1610 family)